MTPAYISHLIRRVFLCSILFYSSLVAQNHVTKQPVDTALMSCFTQSIMPWNDADFLNKHGLNNPVSLVIFRSIGPINGQELLLEIDQKIYRTNRLLGQSWEKPVAVDPSIGRFVRKNWSALRDDLVKPFRANSVSRKDENPNNTVVTSELVHKATPPKDKSYNYILFYKDFCLERHFNQKDLGPEWAEFNQTYTFNQTLKLTKLHRMVDDVFLCR